MVNLAKTYQNLFPMLFDSTYSKENYTFGHSRRLRTTQSCKAFATGLFGLEQSENIEMTNPNAMLRV